MTESRTAYSYCDLTEKNRLYYLICRNWLRPTHAGMASKSFRFRQHAVKLLFAYPEWAGHNKEVHELDGCLKSIRQQEYCTWNS